MHSDSDLGFGQCTVGRYAVHDGEGLRFEQSTAIGSISTSFGMLLFVLCNDVALYT